MTTFIQTLLTSHELLSKLIVIPLFVFETLIQYLLFSSINQVDVKNKTKILYIVITTLFIGIIKFFIPNPYDLAMLLIINIFIVHTLLKLSKSKAISSVLVISLLACVCEGIFFLTFYLGLGFDNVDEIAKIPIYNFIITFGIDFLVCMFVLLIRFIKMEFSLSEDIPKLKKIILLANFILAISISFPITIYFIVYHENFHMPFIIYIIIATSLFLILSIYNLFKGNQLEITKRNLENSESHNKTLNILLDNIRTFKHDYVNIVQAIGGYVNVDDMRGLKSYYSGMLEECQKVNNLSSLNTEVINSPPIFALLTSKYNTADNLGIKINLEVFIDLTKLYIPIYEFTKILGILIDNAIEASIECDKKIINIILRTKPSSKEQLLIIENTYSNKNIDTELIYNKNYSTKNKKNNSGLGLWEVRQILKRLKNTDLITSKDDLYFKQHLSLWELKKGD